MKIHPTTPAEPNRRSYQRNREPHTKPATFKLPVAEKGAYTCPKCHNTEHPAGAKFCMICGLAFPLD